jgi:hypothetical protein
MIMDVSYYTSNQVELEVALEHEGCSDAIKLLASNEVAGAPSWDSIEELVSGDGSPRGMTIGTPA